MKNQNFRKIIELLNMNNTISIHEITDELKVSDMTARRYLSELHNLGLLVRIHGGAKKVNDKNIYIEKSNLEKQAIQIEEKKEIAEYASQFINNGDTIFIGPGTTLEFLAAKINIDNLRVVTNSLPVFLILNRRNLKNLILIGGEYRDITGAFVGRMAIDALSSLKFSKSFVSCNGVSDNAITTYNVEEGEIQQLAFKKSHEKFLLMDNQKFDKFDFYNFYDLININYLITDSSVNLETLNKYEKYTTILAPNHNQKI